MSVQMTKRPVPSSLAPIVEGLELRQPPVVTERLLADLTREAGSRLHPRTVAERLVRLGWLLPLRTRGAWEFAPAARAGRYSSGDPLIELRALLAHQPKAPVAVAFDSAIWSFGYSRHQPTVPIFAHRHGWRSPRALSHLRSVTYEWRLSAPMVDGLPVWQPATVAVAAAHRPDIQADWSNADDWLSETMRATAARDILREAKGRGVATLARVGYLAEWSGVHDVADAVERLLPQPLPVSYLGPRRPRGRWVKRWRLYDALLPDR